MSDLGSSHVTTVDRHPDTAPGPNLVPIAQASAMQRSGMVSTRIGGLLARWDYPTELDLGDDRPVVFASNHRSFFDVVAALSIFHHVGTTARILVRADMFDKPVVGSWLRRIGCIPASPRTRRDAEREAIDALKAGESVAIMPEGRLIAPADRLEGVGKGRRGASRIAAEAGAVVVPVAFTGTEKVWPVGRPIPRLALRGRPVVRARIGRPLDLTGTDERQDTETIMAALGALVRSMEA